MKDEKPKSLRYQRPTAKARALKMLARRDHSEKEIQTKLKESEYTPEEIAEALNWVREKGWIKPPEQLSEMFARHLHQRGKGQAYINNYLKQKGLPPLKEDQEVEIEKALVLAQKYVEKESSLDRELKVKIMRRLISRGYSIEVARKVVYEKLRNS